MDFFDFLMNAAEPNREPGAAAESDAVLDQVPRGGSGDAFFDVPVTSVPVSDLTGGVGLPPEAPLPGTAPVFEPAPLPAELPAGPAQPAAEPVCDTAAAGQALLNALNPEQAEVVRHDTGALLVLAGAGSGKTMAITRRIAWLVDVRRVSPYQILAITFTNKAAQEMKARIAQLIGPLADRMWIGTFHAMFARILRMNAAAIGYTPQFTIIDTGDQLSLITQTIKDLNLSDDRFKPRAILGMISSAKNQLQSLADYEKNSGPNPIAKVTVQVWARYQNQLKNSNAMDFDDILVNMVTLLREHPDIREQLQERFRYILVDEYQDTNGAQYETIRLLGMRYQNVCVVGDDDQSIYAFRGADITNILNFEKDYPRCRTIRLEQNYRSTAMILDAANQVIANNKGRKSKKLWTRSEKGEAITYYCGYDQYDEARYVADEITRRIRQSGGRLSYRNFAILYRANAMSRNLEGSFRERAIPYRVFGGLRFYDRQEIKDVIAYLRLIMFPGDNLSLERVINRPRRGIGAATVETIRYLAEREGVSGMEICQNASRFPELSRSARKLPEFAALIGRLRAGLETPDLDFAGYIEFVEHESGLIQSVIEEKEKSKDITVDRIENLKELLSDAAEFESQYVRELLLDDRAFLDTDGSAEAAMVLAGQQVPAGVTELLNAFLEQSALYSEMDLEDSGDDYVRLMTIHAAKGLEFEVVFLVGAEETIFPSRRSVETPEGEEEERRLAYVAITRAERKLYVTSARSRMLYGQTQCLPVSRFVHEIPASCIEAIGGRLSDECSPSRVSGAARDRRAGSAPEHPAGSVSGRGPQAGGTAAAGCRSRTPAGLRQGMDYLKQSAGRPAAQAASGAILPESFRPGMRVRHPRFGSGSVIKTEPIANDLLLLVRFDKGMEKPMMARQSKLTPER